MSPLLLKNRWQVTMSSFKSYFTPKLHQSLLYHRLQRVRCKLFKDKTHDIIVEASQMNAYSCIDWMHCQSESKYLHFYVIFLNDNTQNMINKNFIIFCIMTQMVMITHLWWYNNGTLQCKLSSRKVNWLNFIFRSQW